MAKSPIENPDSALDRESELFGGSKGRATPTRREREAANIRPLVSSDRKAANRESRAKTAQARDRARIGMAAGEEKYLLLKDRGPQRRYVRDYVDARFSVGEVFVPALLVFVLTSTVPSVAIYATVAMYAFILAVVIDSLIMGRLLKGKLGAKFGEDSVQRGATWYAAMRGAQLRLMRLPKPQVKRKNYPN
ncbi:MAG: DUF3043 domain-containing protein [Microbacteriaceae bacterium]|nr:DUF3043 domain-containing protein [Microbacteriaceae bacterium]